MRTVDPILAAAMLSGAGDPIARITVGATTYNLISYLWDNLKFECQVFGEIPDAYQTPFTATRGMSVNGTEYLMTIGTFYIESNTLSVKGVTTIKGHALPSGAVTAINGYDDALAVLNDAGTDYDLTFKAIPNAQDWLDTWDFFKDGQTLNLVNAKLLQNLLMQKRRASFFLRYDGVYLTNPAADQTGYATITPLTLPETTDYIQTRLTSVNCYWQDEGNFSHNNYEAGGTAPGSAPKQNLGYIHSSVTDSDVGTLGIDGGGKYIFIQIPNLALEQGDPVETDVYSITDIIRFKEIYNTPQGSGWRQQVWDHHWQPFDPNGDVPITIQQTEITQIINNTIQQYFAFTSASDITVDASTFDHILGPSHVNLQAALQQVDDHTHPLYNWLLSQYFDIL